MIHSLAFCPITLFLSLAFADNAFLPNVESPADLLSKRVPTDMEALKFEWKPDVAKTPILRQSELHNGLIDTSPIKMLSFNSFNSDITNLGLNAGFPDAVVSYCIRRGVANAVDGEFHIH